MLRHAITLASDPLSLNVCNVYGHDKIMYQILAKSNNPRSSYSWFQYVQFASSAVLDLNGSEYSQFPWPTGSIMYQRIKFHHSRVMRGWVIDDLSNFSVRF